MPHKVGTGVIFGITAEDGVADTKRVVLIDRSNLTIVAKTVADANGAYQFTGLNEETDDYLVFAVDDNGSPPKNALIQDYITPVPGYQGAEFPGNFYLKCRRYNPISLFLPLYNDNGAGVLDWQSPMGGNISVPSAVLGQYWTNDTGGSIQSPSVGPMIPTAPYIGQGRAQDAIARSPVSSTAGHDPNIRGRWDGLSSSTMKLTTVTFGHTKVGATWSHAVYYIITNYNTSYTHQGLTSIYWDGTDKIEIRSRTNQASAGFLVTNVTVPPEFIGLDNAMVTVVQQANASYQVFINDTLVVNNVYTWTGPNGTAIPGYQSFGNGRYTGSTGSSILTTGTGLYDVVGGFYTDVPFTITEVQDLYSYYSTPQTPIVSGYLKEVVIDTPQRVFTMSDIDPTLLTTEWLSQTTTCEYKNPAGVTTGVVTPIVGISGVQFGGASALHSQAAIGPVGDFYGSWEWWMQPVLTSTDQYIMLCTERDLTDMWFVGISTGNQIRLYLNNSSGTESILFNHTIDDTAIHQYVVTLNKRSGEAKLYVDGVLVDTQSTSAVPMLVGINDSESYGDFSIDDYSTPSRLHIGGEWNNNSSTVVNPFTGKLAALSCYGKELTPARILAHYNARNTV